MKRFLIFLSTVALAAVMQSCSSAPPPAETSKAPEPPPTKAPEPAKPEAKAETKSEPARTEIAKAIPPAAPKAEPKAPKGANLMDPSTMQARAPATFRARLVTTKGPIVIEVTREWAPNGADHFYNLIRGGYYSDAAFFRVVPGFMVQFGISARPEVSRIWAERKIPDDPVKQSNTRGFVTYAQTSAPNSRSTQLFINYGNNSFLDGQRFAPFGRVVEGMEVVDSIYSGYGEQPDQFAITNEGKAYLDKSFPRLDRVLSTSLVPATQ